MVAIAAPRERTWRLVPALPVAVLGLMVVAAIFAPLLVSTGPQTQDLANTTQPPFWLDGGSLSHPLGTDSFGRDELSRLLYATRISLSCAALAILIAVVIGTGVGIMAGYR